MFLTYVIVDDVIAGGVDGSLADGLTNEEIVIPLWQSDSVVHDRS